MSIFDVIKYNNIDLDDNEELLKLPKELIKLYWIAANFSCFHDWTVNFLSKTDMCYSLSVAWAFLEDKKVIYDKVLKEYNNESL